jgi:sugar O-acyltransferase (sialic acid O-acetyltransferase NeuD family)
MKPLVIYGAGGFAREVLFVLRDMAKVRQEWDVLGFLDDAADQRPTEICGLPILGGVEWVRNARHPVHVVLGVGFPSSKYQLVRRLRNDVAGFPSLIHPSAILSEFVTVGEGVVVTAGNVLTTQVRVEDFAMLNLSCTVGHDSIVGAYSSIAPGTNLSGNVRVGEGAEIGTGAKVVPGVTIGGWSVVGAGAVVVSDLPSNSTAVGIPARVIKTREVGWHSQ